MEFLEQNLGTLAGTLKLILESISLLCVLLGLFKSGQVSLFHTRRTTGRRAGASRLNTLPLMDIRMTFGSWLSLALEFQLAGDIVNTTVAPSLDALAKLGAIAVIRTFLNYFLSRELTEELALTQERQQATSRPEEESHATIT